MRYIPGNAQNIGVRQSQQDSFGFGELNDQAFLAHAGFLAVVCDGMGGMQHGDLASRCAVQTILSEYRAKTEDESIPDALERSTRAANAAVCQLSRSMGTSEGLGTTLVAVVLQETNLYWISVGDSNAYLCRHGSMMLLTQPHVFSNLLDLAVTRGSISRDDADRHPERDSLTSFVGIESLEEIDRNTQPFPLAEGDTILITSDGVFKTLSDEEMMAAMQGPPQGWPELLVARTMAAGREHQDNVTAITVTVTSAIRDAPAPAPSGSGITLPPATPIGIATGIGFAVPSGLAAQPQAPVAPPPISNGGAPFGLLGPAPAMPPPALPANAGPPAAVAVESGAIEPPSLPAAAQQTPIGVPPVPASAPRFASMRWWPALLVVAFLLLAGALMWSRRESAKPAATRPPDTAAPVAPATPPATGPLRDVQPPPIDAGKLIKPDPSTPGAKSKKSDKPDVKPPAIPELDPLNRPETKKPKLETQPAKPEADKLKTEPTKPEARNE